MTNQPYIVRDSVRPVGKDTFLLNGRIRQTGGAATNMLPDTHAPKIFNDQVDASSEAR